MYVCMYVCVCVCVCIYMYACLLFLESITDIFIEDTDCEAFVKPDVNNILKIKLLVCMKISEQLQQYIG
jgi:hypothetical protein